VHYLAQIFADHAADLPRWPAVIQGAVFGLTIFTAVLGPTLSTPERYRAVADQRKVIDDELGWHAELGNDSGAVELFVGHGVASVIDR